MRVRTFPARVTARQIGAVVRFLPVFEAIAPDGFVHYDKPTKRVGKTVVLGHLMYHPAVCEFERACYESGLVQSFDWGAWSDEVRKYIDDARLLGSADLGICIKLITAHLRAERFCEGHLEGVLRSGHINAILRRLKQLEEEAKSNARTGTN
jgi:hypothetical protein